MIGPPKETTKEQQVRELREARFKRRVTPAAPVTRVTGCPRCKLLEAQIAAFEAEVKWLKQTLSMSRQVGGPVMTGAERVRNLRARRKQAHDG